ncbi:MULTISPECIES: histidine phosphatase family protein [unclassified Mycobacterium]|uniref:histidine phosphatase family protein n=1 Tax=unclassified Mycobacterium TaxID=2642494 RepID=UPI0029C64070|nr:MULTISPECIES: histidine phosphatase family protein [unclassified Mycobacterium]
MHLLLIRHALPLASADPHGADPSLSEAGVQMACRLPAALRRHRITRLVSSPQARARQTAHPIGAELNLTVEVDERLAEYDYGLTGYVPMEKIRAQDPAQWARLVAGELPDSVDVEAFEARVLAAADELTSQASSRETTAVVCHGGVINVVLRRAVRSEKLFPFVIDYASVSHLGFSSRPEPVVLGINNTEHVWDLLPRIADR